MITDVFYIDPIELRYVNGDVFHLDFIKLSKTGI